MLKRSHGLAIGGAVLAGVVLAAVPLVQRASATPFEAPVGASTSKQQHPAASLTAAPACFSGDMADGRRAASA